MSQSSSSPLHDSLPSSSLPDRTSSHHKDDRTCDSGSTSTVTAPSVELSNDDFKRIFLSTGLERFEGLVAQLSPRYLEFANDFLKESCDVITEALRMFNELNRQYEEHNNIPASERIKFLNHSHAQLLHHPRDSESFKQQIIAVPSPIAESWKQHPSSSIAWHHVVAFLHIEPDDHPLDECSRCVGILNQARPDLPGCFAFVTSRWSFRIVWSDPGALHASEALDWLEDGTLFFALGFIHRLHFPLLGDPTLRLEQCTMDPTHGPDQTHKANFIRSPHEGHPVWLVDDAEGGVYRVTTILSVGNPWTSQNWVVAAEEYRPAGATSFSICPRIVIKDSWCARQEEAFCESAVLNHVHGDGVVPGVCRVVSSFVVPGAQTLTFPDYNIQGRRKHRLILDGTSTELYTCPSVVDFLIVMYDVLEVLKHIDEQRAVLHRDLSLRNVLRASHSSDTPAAATNGRFAGDLLSYKYPAIRRGPACTLIDFDISFWTGRTPEFRLKQPVGTPTFAAHAVSRFFRTVKFERVFPVPHLSGHALECYLHVHGEPAYQERSLMHDNFRYINDYIPEDRAFFKPHHDAESCFWIIAHFLLTALPSNADPVLDDTRTAQRVCTDLELHEVGTILDMRECIFDTKRWPGALHPSLKRFSKLLATLISLVYPIYDLCDPPLSSYHLHECFQRVLLQEICDTMDAHQDVALNVERRRELHSSFIRKAPQVIQHRSNKRRRSDSINERTCRRPRFS